MNRLREAFRSLTRPKDRRTRRGESSGGIEAPKKTPSSKTSQPDSSDGGRIQKRTDNTLPVGTNPISQGSFTVEYLGLQKADNSCSHRDLGFTGSIAGKWYAVYGDTLWCNTGVTDPANDTSGFHGMVRDSVSAMTSDPLVVHDLNLNSDTPVAHQLQFVPFNSDWGETNVYGFGGTSLCETDAITSTAALFYLVNANDDGLKGAGVAKVQVISGTPTVTQRYGDNGWWWNATTTPRYGDVCAYRDENSEYIYAYGGAPTSITEWGQTAYVYLARVKASEAFDLSKYEYWWGLQQGWKPTVLTTFTSETAVWWGTGQGQIVYSPYYECYILVNMGNAGNDVKLRTASALEGPWTADVTVYTATPIDGGYTYAGVAHPYLDETGKTLVISWTNNNNIEVAKITFSK